MLTSGYCIWRQSLKKYLIKQNNFCISPLNLFQQTEFPATLNDSLYHAENWGFDLVSAALDNIPVSLMALPPLQSEQDLTSSQLNSEKQLWTTEHPKLSPLPVGNLKKKPLTDLWLQSTIDKQLSRFFVSEKDKSNIP